MGNCYKCLGSVEHVFWMAVCWGGFGDWDRGDSTVSDDGLGFSPLWRRGGGILCVFSLGMSWSSNFYDIIWWIWFRDLEWTSCHYVLEGQSWWKLVHVLEGCCKHY